MSFLHFFNKRNRTYRRIVWLTTVLFCLWSTLGYAAYTYGGSGGGGGSGEGIGETETWYGGSYGGDAYVEGEPDKTATGLMFTTQPANSMAGQVFNVVVQIVDANGDVVTSGSDSTKTVTLALLNNPAGGTLSGTKTKAAVAGVADYTGKSLSLNLAGDLYTIQASATLDTAGAVTAVSNSFSIGTGIGYAVKSELSYDAGVYRINSWLESQGTIVADASFSSSNITVTIVDRNGDSVTAPVFDKMMNNSVFRHSWVPPSSGAYTYLANVAITYNGSTFAGNFTYNPAVMGGTLATIGTQTAAINWADVSHIKDTADTLNARMNWNDINAIKSAVGVHVSGGSMASQIATILANTSKANWDDIGTMGSRGGINWEDLRVLAKAGIRWQELGVAGINWADLAVVTKQGVNWADLGRVTKQGINWADVGAMAAQGVNWQDLKKMTMQRVNWSGIEALASAGVNWTGITALSQAQVNWSRISPA